MYCTNFTYADDSSLEHGVMICSFNGGGGENINGGKAEITTVKAPNSNQWLKINAVYNEPLSFSFEICKNPHETIHANVDFAFSPIALSFTIFSSLFCSNCSNLFFIYYFSISACTSNNFLKNPQKIEKIFSSLNFIFSF